MKVLATRRPVIRECPNCWTSVEIEASDLIPKLDKVWDGHIFYVYSCPECGKEAMAHWGTGQDPIPEEWNPLLPKL